MRWLSRLSSLNERIKQCADKLKSLADLTKPGGDVSPLCGNDVIQFNNLKLRIEEKKAEGKLAEAAVLEKRREEMGKWIAEAMEKQIITPESIAKATSLLKEEKVELEAEREALLKSQSNP